MEHSPDVLRTRGPLPSPLKTDLFASFPKTAIIFVGGGGITLKQQIKNEPPLEEECYVDDMAFKKGAYFPSVKDSLEQNPTLSEKLV